MKLEIVEIEGDAVPPDEEGHYKGTFVTTVFNGHQEGRPTINDTVGTLGYDIVRIQTPAKLNVMLIVEKNEATRMSGYTTEKANEIVANINSVERTPIPARVT